jgi:minimal PKS chain-length factor (CLF/KS beta)
VNATAVTGIGVVAPNGVGLSPHWSATMRGDCALRRISRFDPASYRARIAGEVAAFEPEEWLPSRLIPQTDRMTQFALVASDLALADAGVDTTAVPPMDLGVVTASAAGGFEFGQRELQKMWSQGPNYVSAYMSFAWFYAVNSGQISIRHQLKGPSGVLVTDQAGGLDAIGHARRKIRQGLRYVLTGGMEAALCPYGITAYLASGQLSARDDPDHAYLPFDQEADGYVAGEGGAILMLEDAGRARERGAASYGEIAGYGATFDPPPGSGRGPNLQRAAEMALDDAGVRPGDIAVVFADAAAVPELDRAEAEAVRGLFGAGQVPVTAPKTMTGRLGSGAGALDVAVALMALRHRVIPPTVNVAAPVPSYGIDLVTGQPRPLRGDSALVLARGARGFNSAVVVRSTGAASRS